ncbi:MAG: 4Fe-4S binding protein [Caldisericia bacterium]|nr:4Fe-4S binding protein [Caldisericia bacterium]
MAEKKKKTWFKWRYIRYISQALFVGFVIRYSWLHVILEKGVSGRPGPIDCICPLGGIVMLPKFLQTGQYIQRVGNTNLVVLAALVLSLLAFGGGFCGWMCPMGSVQEWLYRLRKKIWKKDIKLPLPLHKALRWFRYALLAFILIMTYVKVDLVFKALDPFNALFTWGDHTSVVGLIVLGIVLVLSFVIERPFCQYACPLGGAIQPIAKLSATGITRNEETCINCGICDKECPYQLPISTVKNVNRGLCIECLRCIDECPVPNTLEITMGWVKGGAK